MSAMSEDSAPEKRPTTVEVAPPGVIIKGGADPKERLDLQRRSKILK